MHVFKCCNSPLLDSQIGLKTNNSLNLLFHELWSTQPKWTVLTPKNNSVTF